ncbi:MAG: saccharopine dehydrogenase NADP-binding domain-containing protein [Pseudomonadota bacterium]
MATTNETANGKRILILGAAGNTGARVARFLRRQRPQTGLILAGRTEAPLLRLAKELAGDADDTVAPVEVRRIDASDPASVEAGLDGVGLAVVASSTSAFVETVVRALCKARVDYIDPQLGAGKIERLRALAPEIERAGICVMTDAGFSPGMQAVVARHAASRVEKPRHALVATAAFMDWSHVDGSPSTMEEAVGGFGSVRLLCFRQGAWVKARLGADGQRVGFGPPIGERGCTPLFVEELRDLPVSFPTLEEIRHVSCGFNWLVNFFVMPVVMLAAAMSWRAFTRLAGRLLLWALKRSRPPFRCIVQAEVTGEKDGQPASAFVRVSHADGYDITAIPVVAGILQWLDGNLARPGLFTLGNLVEPVRYVADIEKMGATVDLGGTAASPPSC